MSSEYPHQREDGQPKPKRRSGTKYTKRLTEVDKRVSDFIQQVTRETTRAYRITISLHKASYSMPVLAFVTGLYLILFRSKDGDFLSMASICIISGVILLIYLQNRSPVKYIRYLINNLMKLNVLLSGYVRQIYQVDAVFEDMFESKKMVEPEVAEQMLNHLQDAMIEAMNAISQASIDMDI